MRKLLIIILMLLVALSTGCSEDTKTAKQIFADSIDNRAAINSTTFSGKMDVTIDSNLEMEADVAASPLLMLNQFSIAFSGKGNDDPLQMEIDTTMTTNMQGMDLEFKVPMFSKDDALYIKVPEMMKSMITLDKDYLIADISSEISAEDKTELQNLSSIVLKDIDDSSFAKLDGSSYSIKDAKVGDVVAVSITQEGIKNFLDKFMIDGLPEVINFIDKKSLTEEQEVKFEEFKLGIENKTISADTIFNDISKKLTVNKFEMINVYDKDGFLREIIFDVDVTMIDEEKGNSNLVIKGECVIETINKELQFEMQIPSIDQTAKIEELDLIQK
ncbi:MAG: hypothetical protein AB7V16_07545 [Vulcanibacillus sp.]